MWVREKTSAQALLEGAEVYMMKSPLVVILLFCDFLLESSLKLSEAQTN